MGFCNGKILFKWKPLEVALITVFGKDGMKQIRSLFTGSGIASIQVLPGETGNCVLHKTSPRSISQKYV